MMEIVFILLVIGYLQMLHQPVIIVCLQNKIVLYVCVWMNCRVTLCNLYF